MTYVQPEQVVKNMVQAGAAKSKLPIRDLVIRGALAGALLGFGTTLAFTAETQTQMGIVGALLFPACFVIIILLGLELVTGNFALIPLAVLEKKATWQGMLTNWFWVIVGHVIGGSFYAMLYVVAATHLGQVTDHAVAQKIIQVAEAKTLGYSALGTTGLLIVFVKGILCNWMVALGAVMAMTSQATLGKIVAMWLPILLFFAQGFEHAVVNMFVIPAGMMLGADITLSHWWLWNQIPVLLGNLVGGLLFTGLALYVTYRSQEVNKGKEQVKNNKGKRERMVS
ncbi:formate/nitrite transporter family protein [Peribacillus asahii]|uniref:Formate/nitrite transporter family protein n=1 Tax=Peribacillus asahii TaxID=228899 RepID=A0A398BG81_9BACI|nr:formate/nitrite transporter family protein [Peribacillus asahii]RID88231.1 formate/nitrite transporter family protein [Peribacillus asahii]